MSANERVRCDVTAAASANRVAPVTSPVRVETTQPRPGTRSRRLFSFWGGRWKEGSVGRAGRESGDCRGLQEGRTEEGRKEENGEKGGTEGGEGAETRAGVDAGVSRRWRLRQAPIWVY